jgi:hypothetical protein
MNILQIEDDLKGMPTDVIVQHLQNPTGLIPTYLAAGELNRREKMQVARAEAPQETVVDEIIQKAMPMGGMPMPQAPMPQMPMPRPEEVMVSDTITETGIAGLPAPNVGNYKEGGIIGYQDGGDIDYEDFAEDLAVDAGLMSILGGIPGFFMSPGTAEAATLYDDEEFATMVENNNLAGPAAVGAGVVANEARKKAKAKKTPKIKPTKAGLIKAGGVAALDKVKKLLTPKATPKKKPGRPKKQATPPAPQQGPLTRATVAGIKKLGQGVGPLTRGVKAAATRYPVESIAGLAGLNALFNEGVLYGESDEERATRLAADEAEKAARNQAQLDRMEKTRLQNQAELDAAQAQRDEEARRRAYLALALGGAKTMAGQSPFALTNIGEGIGTGVAGLVELDEADATRRSAKEIADDKIRQSLYEFNQERRLKIADFREKLSENMDFRAAVDAQLEALGQDRTTIDTDTLVSIEEKVIMQFYPELGPTAGATMVAGETYAEV